MYPLLSIMCTDYITDSQRAWARGRLLFISDVIGLNHARVLSSVSKFSSLFLPSLRANPQFQLRLPSMIIRRDILVHSPSIAAAMMAAAARAERQNSPPTTVVSIQSPPTMVSPARLTPAKTASSPPSYTMSPLQQRDAMERDQREKDRKVLLSKASNAQGESVEKLLAVYLAV